MGFIFGAAHEPKSGLWIRHTLSMMMKHTALGGVFENQPFEASTVCPSDAGARCSLLCESLEKSRAQHQLIGARQRGPANAGIIFH